MVAPYEEPINPEVVIETDKTFLQDMQDMIERIEKEISRITS